MSDKVTKLHLVQTPRVEDKIREQVIAELERVLEEARAGNVSEFLIIIQHADQTVWSERSSDTCDGILKWVGRLEVTKLDWIAKLTRPEEDPYD